MIGIYIIKNKINNQCYIGQSVNITRRWRQHKEAVANGVKTPLYLAIQKYGIDNFDFQILEECSIEELNDREIYWIEKYDSYYKGYNQTRGGQQYSHNVKLSDEDYDKIVQLLQDSSYTQKEISKMFSVGEDTISEINTGKIRFHSTIKYPIRNNRKENYCIDCGVKILNTSTRCINCKSKKERKAERPCKEVLFNEIKASSFSAVGRKYGVSDNTIRKWCKAYGLPTKASEYKGKES